MFKDEEDDDYELSEFENWYDENYKYFKRDSKQLLGPTLDISLFYSGIYCPVLQEIAPSIRKLMLKQYPIIDTEYRQMVLEYINWVVYTAGHRLLLNLYTLIQDQKEGINLRKKYPDFDSWIETYARPAKPYLITELNYSVFSTLNYWEKKDLIEEENRNVLDFFNREQHLKKEYYDIIQPVVFKYIPALQELDYDGWIIYAVHIREDYEDYKFRCEHLETFIEYDFPEEDINLKYDEFQVKFQIKYNEKWEKEHHLPDSGMKKNNPPSQTDN